MAAVSVRVVDAAAPAADSQTVHLTTESSVGELRALCCSLPLPSVERLFQFPAQLQLVVCHNGKVLGPEAEEMTVQALGITIAPVVVILTQRASAPPNQTKLHTRTEATAEQAPADSLPSAQEHSASPNGTVPPPDAVCRICFGTAFENGAGRLISPCRCMGSMRWVHIACLNEWRSSSANPRSMLACDQCGYEYNLRRTVYAAWLEDKRLHRAAAMMILAMSVLSTAMILGPLGVAEDMYLLLDCSPADLASTNRVGRIVASLWCWQMDWFLVGLLGPGLAGLAVSIQEAYHIHRHVENGYAWMIPIVSLFAANGRRPLRLLFVGGLCYSVKVALAKVEGVAKVQLTKWGTMILDASL